MFIYLVTVTVISCVVRRKFGYYRSTIRYRIYFASISIFLNAERDIVVENRIVQEGVSAVQPEAFELHRFVTYMPACVSLTRINFDELRKDKHFRISTIGLE